MLYRKTFITYFFDLFLILFFLQAAVDDVLAKQSQWVSFASDSNFSKINTFRILRFAILL